MEYKGYKIESDGVYCMQVIKAIGKGSVNLELRGLYSNAKKAQIAIDSFLSRAPEKTTKKGKVKDVETK